MASIFLSGALFSSIAPSCPFGGAFTLLNCLLYCLIQTQLLQAFLKFLTNLLWYFVQFVEVVSLVGVVCYSIEVVVGGNSVDSTHNFVLDLLDPIDFVAQ